MHLTRNILAAAGSTIDRKKLRKRLRAFGIAEIDLAEVVALLDTARAVRSERDRRRSAQPADPLIFASVDRQRRAATIGRVKRARAAAMYPAWTAAFRAKVEDAAALGHDAYRDREAAAATMEAVTREARKRGWTVRHTSTSRDGRASSRYIAVPGLGECRLSDHAIPETAERASRTTGPRWNGEVIVDDWRTTRLETYMRRVILAAAGRGSY